MFGGLESPLSVDAAQRMHVSRMGDWRRFEGGRPGGRLAGGVWVAGRDSHFWRVGFLPFRVAPQSVGWARSGRVLFIWSGPCIFIVLADEFVFTGCLSWRGADLTRDLAPFR